MRKPTTMNNLTTSSRYVYIAAFAILVCTLSVCSAGTTGRRPVTLTQPLKKNSGNNMVVDEAFRNAGRTTGLEIWRIEDFKPVPYPKNDYGKFYTGDSYIVLQTKVDSKGHKSWNVHFWLGLETTQDESGAAAILTVQLDDSLGGDPIQYRETQEHESQLFLSYFKNGVRYLPGGKSSGFTHVDRNAFEKRLFQVKGSRNIRVKQVDASISAMNKGDCFILDAGRQIYVYVGIKSKRIEKIKAIAAANQIRDQDHAGKAKVTIVDEFSPESDFDEFFKVLGGGSQNQVPEETVGGDDQQFESTQERIVTLYRVSDASGKIKVEQVAQKPLMQSHLDTNDCFILDTTDSNIFVWVGKKCNNNEKGESMNRAQNFLKEKRYPSWTQIQRIVEGAEPTAFTQYFKTWKSVGEIRSRLVRAASQENQGFTARLFHCEIRENSNKFTTEEIVDFKQDDLSVDDVMLLDIGKKVYAWIGSGASVKERSGAPDLAKKYLQKLGRDEIEVIIVNQGQEPNDFKEHFDEWNPEIWDNVTSYDDVKSKVAEDNKSVDA